MSSTTNPLQTLSNCLRRLQLHHQIDTADIDSQLQRTRTNQRRQFASLQLFLDIASHRIGQTSVMCHEWAVCISRSDEAASDLGTLHVAMCPFSVHGIQPVRGVLCLTTAIGEHQRRIVSLDVVQNSRYQLRPYRSRVRTDRLSHPMHTHLDLLGARAIHDRYGARLRQESVDISSLDAHRLPAK